MWNIRTAPKEFKTAVTATLFQKSFCDTDLTGDTEYYSNYGGVLNFRISELLEVAIKKTAEMISKSYVMTTKRDASVAL